MQKAQAALAQLKALDQNLALVARKLSRLYKDQSAVEHILDGLRGAGFD
jgi:hypothetical protein